ncbi:mitogen-activated protein kinase kinase kinase 18-like [Humulus lupulus]|uniref:mitogen-activated protein kinase kinase kinase 18-like n=1 Tax=Humulus lupulus TaxID=3486 RepID=UPI002B4109D8|nr:mitogen-activated protein kinase kinase kinase 18-like [Humulus lupulus]
MDWSRGHIIGRGSSATVSVATSAWSGQVFAVKSAELSHSKALQQEQSVLSSLISPHVVSYIGQDITTENDRPMYNLFLEYMPGGSLTDVVSRLGGRLDELLIGHYTREIVRGLEYLHSLEIVHCDIKGRNILIGEKGPKIADFGCARRVNSAGPIAGTPMFMAPEAARGEHQGFPSDIWSLGCTIIEMASGGSPWPDGSDPIAILYRIAYSGESPEIPSFLSDEARDFLGRCLRRNPEERWTASQLLKHPFIGESKQNNESNNSKSISPTSILDHEIWNSLEDELESFSNFSSVSNVGESAADRIRRLSSVGQTTWSLEQNWITVRSSNDDEEEEVDMVGGSGERVSASSLSSCCDCSSLLLELNFSDKNRADILEVFPHREQTSVVVVNFNNLILENDRHKLLLPFCSTFLKL